MLNKLPKIYRKDKFVNFMYDSGSIPLSTEKINNEVNYNNIFFSTLNESGCLNYENDLNIVGVGDLSNRRNMIESKWKGFEKCSVASLQKLVDRYFNGDVTVSYNGDAQIIYTATIGFQYKYSDDTYNSWLSDNDMVFPAHMEMVWVYDKNKWGDYYFKNSLIQKQWSYMKGRTWDDTLNNVIQR